MKLKSFLLFLPLLFVGTGALAQVGYTHIELQGGYELFPDMSKKSGGNLNFGVRYAFSERYFMATIMHCGINNGSYEGQYAGEVTNLKHTMREYMLGVGPGIYLYNGGDQWIYADVLVGYGFGEELKSSEDSERRSLNGLATAVQIGIERQTNSGWIIGINTGGFLVGGKIRPTVCLKCGALFSI